MANSFGLLLAAIVICFITARLMKDAKAFSRLMAILVIGLLVGAGVKEVYKECTSTPEKAAVATVESAPTYSSNTPVCLECITFAIRTIRVRKTRLKRDSTVTEAEGLPTARTESKFIDDS